MSDFFENDYPYTDFHELNLSWVIKKIIELSKKLAEFINVNTIKYADPIQWNITRQYEANTIVIDPLTGTAYISTQPVPSGAALTNTDYWTIVFNLEEFVIRAAKNFTNRYEPDTTLTATFPTNTGEWLVWGDVLYRALSNIAVDDLYVVDGNIKHFTMEETYDLVYGWIGDISNLNTTDKSSVVNALNEVNTNLHTCFNNLGNITTLNTVDKTSAVNAINEVNTNFAHEVWIRSRTVNVLDYGADPTGAIDSTTAFKNAFAALPDTTELNPIANAFYIPNGTYIIQEELDFTSKPVEIFGDGKNATILIGWGGADPDTGRATYFRVKRANIHDLRINGSNHSSVGIRFIGGHDN